MILDDDGQTLEVHGRAKDLVRLIVEHQEEINATEMGGIEIHWAAGSAELKVHTTRRYRRAPLAP